MHKGDFDDEDYTEHLLDTVYNYTTKHKQIQPFLLAMYCVILLMAFESIPYFGYVWHGRHIIAEGATAYVLFFSVVLSPTLYFYARFIKETLQERRRRRFI